MKQKCSICGQTGGSSSCSKNYHTPSNTFSVGDLRKEAMFGDSEWVSWITTDLCFICKMRAPGASNGVFNTK